MTAFINNTPHGRQLSSPTYLTHDSFHPFTSHDSLHYQVSHMTAFITIPHRNDSFHHHHTSHLAPFITKTYYTIPQLKQRAFIPTTPHTSQLSSPPHFTHDSFHHYNASHMTEFTTTIPHTNSFITITPQT
jgi:hypothetical protein